jgi:integrase
MLAIGVRVTPDHHVVMQADGLPLQPNSITQAVSKFMIRRGSKVRLHGLRHSHATHMLASGIHPKVASERLGHPKIGITRSLQPRPPRHAGRGGRQGGHADIGRATSSAEERPVAIR